MICLDDKLAELDTAAEHIGRGYDILCNLGYTDLANVLLNLLDEVGCEMASIESELDETL